MNENRLNIMIYLLNMVIVVAFVLMAVFFGQWWISLFSFLLMNDPIDCVERKTKEDDDDV